LESFQVAPPPPSLTVAPILMDYDKPARDQMLHEHELLEHGHLLSCDDGGGNCKPASFPATLGVYREWSDLRDQARILKY
jgi:hypothetical protein